MLSRRTVFKTALGLNGARRALQVQVSTFTTREFTLWTEISSHNGLPSYTRRFLGGRQPLWGMGVTSVILVILNPALLNARTADSRPGPGPLILTSRFCRPYSFRRSVMFSAATWAANGVLLREPRKPEPPAVAHARALP